MTEKAQIDRLLDLMAALRDPERGCAWDRAQDFASIAPYTIEEAYEVADAIARGDMADLREELGDLLLQVVFHARIAQEAGAFAFADVAGAIVAKLIRRHPHVFDAQGNPLPARRRVDDAAAIEAAWERIKAGERAEKAARTGRGDRRADDAAHDAAGEAESAFARIPPALPALTRAEKVSRVAARTGFDWSDPRAVIAKVREEVAEVEASLAERQEDGGADGGAGGDGGHAAVAEEIGDLLFSVANLARHARVDPEAALRQGTRKFERRFAAMARELARAGGRLGEGGLPAMEAAWQAVKRAEKA